MYLPVDHVSPYFNFVSYDDFGKKTVSELLNWIEEKGMANRLNLEAQAFVRDSGIHDYFFRSVEKMFDSLSNSWEQRKLKRNGKSVDTQSEQKQ